MQLGDQHLAQHRAGIGFGAHPAAGEPLTQRGHDRFGDDRAQVGDQQGVLDGLPGVLVEVTAAEQAEHAAAQRVLRFGEPPAQPLQPAFGRGDGADIGRGRRYGCRSIGRSRRFLDLGLGQLHVGDGAFRCVTRDGGVVADGGQAAGVEALRRGLVGGGAAAGADDCVNVMPEEAVYPPDRSTGVAVSVLVDESRLILPRRDRTRPNTTTAATTRTAMTAIAIHRPSDTVPLSQCG